MNTSRLVHIGIDFYESDFGNAFVQDEHPNLRAIRVHEMRKTVPGYENRGFYKATRRWFYQQLDRIYRGESR